MLLGSAWTAFARTMRAPAASPVRSSWAARSLFSSARIADGHIRERTAITAERFIAFTPLYIATLYHINKKKEARSQDESEWTPASPSLQITPDGLYCPRGNSSSIPGTRLIGLSLHILILTISAPGVEAILRQHPANWYYARDWIPPAAIETAAYGETRNINGVAVSLHPAGHILGSAQVRVEYRGEVWVVSGDYKLAPIRRARHSSRCVAIRSLPNRRSDCRSTDGRRPQQSIRRSTTGGGVTRPRVGRV